MPASPAPALPKHWSPELLSITHICSDRAAQPSPAAPLTQTLPQMQIRSQRHAHSHTHTHTLSAHPSLSLSHTHSHTHTHTLSQNIAISVSHTHTHPLR